MSASRQRIASAACTLYLADGPEGFSMRKVAERVGMSAAAIYRHYRSKDELLNEVVVEGLRVLERYLVPALDAPSPFEKLRGMTQGYLNFALEQPRYFDFAFLIPSREYNRLTEELSRPDWTTFREAIEAVGACMRAGVFVPDDPLEIAITIWAEVHGLITLHRTGRFGGDEAFFRATYGRCVERMLQGLRRDPVPEPAER